MRGLGRGYSSANRSSAPAHSDPLGYSGISPAAGQVLQKIIICTPTRRGPTFVRTKVGKIRLGLCPKPPVAGCAGYGLIFDGSPKSIRTAHRIAPKVATGVSALTALRCPKKSSHYSFARFFRPLRILRLASSATGGARLRIPPPPFPMAGKGPGWAGKWEPRATLSGC